MANTELEHLADSIDMFCRVLYNYEEDGKMPFGLSEIVETLDRIGAELHHINEGIDRLDSRFTFIGEYRDKTVLTELMEIKEILKNR
jgi:hypothetical protein